MRADVRLSVFPDLAAPVFARLPRATARSRRVRQQVRLRVARRPRRARR